MALKKYNNRRSLQSEINTLSSLSCGTGESTLLSQVLQIEEKKTKVRFLIEEDMHFEKIS